MLLNERYWVITSAVLGVAFTTFLVFADHHGEAWAIIPATVLVFVVLAQLPKDRIVPLLFILTLVGWFPEYSQSDLNARTAADAPTIYNFRPIPFLTVSVFDYIFCWVVLLWLIRVVCRDPKRLKMAPYFKPVALFLLVWSFTLMHGLLMGNPAYDALREFRNGAYFVITYLMFVTEVRTSNQVLKLARLVILLAAVVGAYGVLRYVLGVGMEFMDHKIVFYDIADSVLLVMGMILLCSVSIENLLNREQKTVAVIASTVMLFTLIFSFRRGAWVGFVAGVVFLFLSYPTQSEFRRTMVRRLAVGVLVVCLILTFVFAYQRDAQEFVVSRIYSIFDLTEDPSNIFRIMDAMNALHSFIQHPLVGVGAGGRYELEYIADDSVTADFMEHVSNTSHDGYLYVLFKAGIIGFVSYFSVFALFFRDWFKLRKMWSRSKERAAVLAIGAILVSFLVTNITEPLSDLPRPSMLVAIILGCGAVLIENRKSLNAGI